MIVLYYLIHWISLCISRATEVVPVFPGNLEEMVTQYVVK